MTEDRIVTTHASLACRAKHLAREAEAARLNPSRAVRLSGGPMDGAMAAPSTPPEHTCSIGFAWSTDRGVFVAEYEPRGEKGVLAFRGYYWPGDGSRGYGLV